MSELQRTRIVAAAAATLEELGCRAITVAQVAGRAGVSRKTFYEHFEDRESCFIAALEEAGEPRPAIRACSRNMPGFRITYRTVRVLEAIGELGGLGPCPSNRQVAAAAGVTDEGQISRLLGRLEGLRLAERVGPRPARGEANAWRLTAWGEEVRAAVEGNNDG